MEHREGRRRERREKEDNRRGINTGEGRRRYKEDNIKGGWRLVKEGEGEIMKIEE